AAPWLGSAPLAPQAAAQAAAQAELRQARQALEQARLQQRVSSARGQELEHQVDALNQGLRQCQVDLAFYRGAHDGPRRPAPRS
ncbi:MAG: hypothetical protein KGL50_05340, partial [Burkholderiales bacterium]|nr:hypothetical protein [Burkholderiales bacterium]